jgi:hypothetical protein
VWLTSSSLEACNDAVGAFEGPSFLEVSPPSSILAQGLQLGSIWLGSECSQEQRSEMARERLWWIFLARDSWLYHYFLIASPGPLHTLLADLLH